jgi:hypothetical protein
VITPADTAPSEPEQGAVSTFNIQAPESAGAPAGIFTGADPDAGGQDPVAGGVAASQASAEARFRELQNDTYGQGSHVGDQITLPDVVSDHSLMTGGDGAGHPFEEDR